MIDSDILVLPERPRFAGRHRDRDHSGFRSGADPFHRAEFTEGTASDFRSAALDTNHSSHDGVDEHDEREEAPGDDRKEPAPVQSRACKHGFVHGPQTDQQARNTEGCEDDVHGPSRDGGPDHQAHAEREGSTD